jgi:hypothetical protein
MCRLALNGEPQGLNIAMVFHGFYCILVGYLIFRSTFLPRILGALMALGGLGLADLSVKPARQPSVPLQSGLPASSGKHRCSCGSW